jgi:hypothetical protein
VRVADEGKAAPVERQPGPAELRARREAALDPDPLPADELPADEDEAAVVGAERERDGAGRADLERHQLRSLRERVGLRRAPASLRGALGDQQAPALDVRDVRRAFRPEREHPVPHAVRHDLRRGAGGGDESEPECEGRCPDHPRSSVRPLSGRT